MTDQPNLFGAPDSTPRRSPPVLNPDGVSVKGCNIIYAPKGQAGEYAALAANPYRGCTHRCAYCLSEDTLIQMADGTTKPIRDILVGDSILGIETIGHAKAWTTRIVTTTVLAKTTSRRTAYKITLEDGTTVICSSDHRWLTDRGDWKYTIDSPKGQRPHLTTKNQIRKLCGAVLTPLKSKSYKTGYLAGIIRGDANLAIYDYSDRKRPSGKTTGIQYRFRLALKDKPALQRAQQYLSEFGVETTNFVFKNGSHIDLNAIGTTSPAKWKKINDLISFASFTDFEWQRGWLAGIFDAEGSHQKQSLRISNTDETILQVTQSALINLGFRSVKEDHPSHASTIRVLGGRNETIRFWQLTNPAISRKFNLNGRALHGSVKIKSIDWMPDNSVIKMFDIMTGTGNFIANGLVSHNCYVPRVLQMQRDVFYSTVTPRKDFLRLLQNDAQKYQAADIHEQVLFSFTCDVYNPTNTTLTRPALQIVQAHGLGISVLTKGGTRALVDLDLYRPSLDCFATTLTTISDDFSLKWEPGAALPEDRIRALFEFHDAGIFTWVSLEPTLNVGASLQIVEETCDIVDLYKIGRANYLPMTATTDWERYTLEMLNLVNKLGVRHYFKADLQGFLPPGYPNVQRQVQHN